MKKNTIARKVTRQFSLLLVIALILLVIGAYCVVSKAIYRENDKYATTIVGIFADLLESDSRERNEPIDIEHAATANLLGNYFCNRYGVDYVYVYTIDEENSSVFYISAGLSDEERKEYPDSDITGKDIPAVLTEEELAVWNGEKDVGKVIVLYDFGHEISTLVLVKDCNGDKVIAGVDISYNKVDEHIRKVFALLALAVFIVLCCLGTVMCVALQRRISAPVMKISSRMQEYIRDRKSSALEIDAKDFYEYTMIASAFNSMTEDIDQYVKNITDLTREQANQQTEVKIAAAIQRGFLSKPQRDWEECSIRAMMLPARDVGGDFYEYIDLGNGRFLIVIADVSGKGIATSMVMSVTLTLIRQYAKMGFEPDAILAKTNDTIVEKNTQMMFITAFVGIFDSRSMTFTYANAGHNHPYIAGENLIELDQANGSLLGIFEGEQYTSAAIPVQPGDNIYLYTDGVTEATNVQKQFFGDERLRQRLLAFRDSRDSRDSREKDLIGFVYQDIQDFTENAEQSDDITMLTLTVRSHVHMILDNDISAFDRLRPEILQLPITYSQKLNLCLAAEEAFMNICSYAYDRKIPESVEASLSVSDHIELVLSDRGVPYNQLEGIADPEEYDINTQIGGLGKVMIVSMVDDARYDYLEGKNTLTLIVYFRRDIHDN